MKFSIIALISSAYALRLNADPAAATTPAATAPETTAPAASADEGGDTKGVVFKERPAALAATPDARGGL